MKAYDRRKTPLLTRRLARAFSWTDVGIILLILVLSVPAMIWFGRNWRVPPDGSWYLLQGWNLISGKGITVLGDPQTVRGPVFPGVLALSMLLLERDVEDLAWASRLLALVNPVLVYFLIKQIAGRATGLIAGALMALFGYTATLDQAFNVDAAMLTPYLLAVVVLLWASRRGGAGLPLLSGALLGLAILTKEAAFVALPLGLLAALLLGWNPRGVLLHYAGVALVCLPWWAWVWVVSGEVYLVGEVPPRLVVLAAGASLVALGLLVLAYRWGILHRLFDGGRPRRWLAWPVLLSWVALVTSVLLKGSTQLPEFGYADASKYVVDHLVPDTLAWYLLPLALLYAFWRTFRGDRLWEFYLALITLQVPVSVFLLVEQYSTRQWMLPQALLYGALAALVVGVFDAATRRREARGGWTAIAGTVVAAVALVGGVLLPLPVQVQKLLGEDTDAGAAVFNQANPSVYDMQRWISENVPAGERVITTWNYSNQMAFLNDERYEWTLLEEDCERGTLGLAREGCLLDTKVVESPPQPTVWFTMDRKRCAGLALSVPTLLRQMEEGGAEYLLITPEPDHPENISALVPYLVESGAFEVAHEAYVPPRPVEKTRNGRTPDQFLAGLALLKRTGEDPRPQPTRMSAATYRELAGCERRGEVLRSFPERGDAIRTNFPNGIAIVGDGPNAPVIQEKVDRFYRR